GQLSNVAGSTIDIVGSSQIDVAAFTNPGTLMINPGATLYLGNTIANSGTITIAANNGAGASLIVDGNNLKLTGGGTVTLDNVNANLYGVGTAVTLTNVNNTIGGAAGQIGLGLLSIVNGTLGTIQAVGPGTGMVLNTGSGTLTNSG